MSFFVLINQAISQNGRNRSGISGVTVSETGNSLLPVFPRIVGMLAQVIHYSFTAPVEQFYSTKKAREL